MRTMLNIFVILCLALMLGATAAADEFIQNGGFETADFTSWTVGGFTTESSVSPNHPHTGTWAGLFITPVGLTVTLSQTLADRAGLYDLSFWISHQYGTPNSLDVQWDGTTIYSLRDIRDLPYERLQITVPGVGSDQVSFVFSSDDIGPNNNSWWLDDVSVADVHALPEPGTLMLLGSGALGLAGVARRHLFGRSTN